jgi:hypothetical protein
MIGGEEDDFVLDIRSCGVVMWQSDRTCWIIWLIHSCFYWFLLDYFPWTKVLFNLFVYVETKSSVVVNLKCSFGNWLKRLIFASYLSTLFMDPFGVP